MPERVAYSALDEPRLADGVRLVGTDGHLEQLSPYRWRLTPEGARAVLEWTVPQDHRALPQAQRSSYEFPYLDADHGLLVAGTLALAPQTDRPLAIRVVFDLPEDWGVLTPWSEIEPGVFRPAFWQELHHDLIAVGHWDFERKTAAGVDLAVAFAPGQDTLRERVMQRITAVVEAEIELFGRKPHEKYLFLFGKPEQAGLGGSVKSGSMTLYADPDLPPAFAEPELVHLVAHEYHHTWGTSVENPPDESELHFVTEGFTDWYSYLVPWRLGFLDDRAFLEKLEQKLGEWEESQTTLGHSVVWAGGPAFYDDPRAYSTVYAGGLVVAALCALETDAPSGEHSLDGLLRALYNTPSTDAGERPGLEEFIALVARYTDPEFAATIEALVTGESFPRLTTVFRERGVKIERSEAPADLSTLRANLDGTRLGGIDSSDPANRIGLATGDVLREVNGRAVESEGDVRRAWATPVDGRVRVTFERNGTERTLDAPIPTSVRYSIDPEILERLRD